MNIELAQIEMEWMESLKQFHIDNSTKLELNSMEIFNYVVLFLFLIVMVFKHKVIVHEYFISLWLDG